MCRALIRAFAVFIAVHFISVPAFARSIEPGEAAVAQLALSAVVNISTWKVRPAQKAGERPRRVKTYASGFIIDPSGIIVTNKHVIDGAIDIKVTLNSGDAVPGKLLAVAVMLDLAVVKVEVDQPLPALNWGNSENLRVGDSVLTIGNPLGLGMSVSVGIVSALNRDLQDTPFDSYIQTDAALNHGNSGGPLIDQDGAVVGVDTYLYNPEKAGGFIGIGFAIPADAAKFVVSRLLDPNKPEPGWLGVTLQDLTPELSDALRVHGAKGAIIAVVQPGGPASKAELRPGDVLSAIGAARQTDARAFMRAIVRTPVGQVVELTFWRGGKEQTVSATVEAWPNLMPGGGIMSAQTSEAMIQQMPDPGMQLAPLTDAAREQYGLDPKLNGVLVASVEEDCEARDLGIVAGDVVTSVQGVPVTTPDDVWREVRSAHEERRPFLAALVQGKSGTRWVPLSIDAARP